MTWLIVNIIKRIELFKFVTVTHIEQTLY